MKLLSVVQTPGGSKQFLATFQKDGRTYLRRFGTSSNYVLNSKKTDKDRENYRKRHMANPGEASNIKNDPMSAGALSYWILWGESRSWRQNVSAFKRRFGV